MGAFEDQEAEQRAKEEEFRRNEVQCLLHIGKLVTYLDEHKNELTQKQISYRTTKHPSPPRFGMWESNGSVQYQTRAESEYLAIVALPTRHTFAIVSTCQNDQCRYNAFQGGVSSFAKAGESYYGTATGYSWNKSDEVLKAIVAKYVIETKRAAEASAAAVAEAAAEERRIGAERSRLQKAGRLNDKQKLLMLIFSAASIPISVTATAGLHHFLQVDCNNSGSCFLGYTQSILDIFIFIINILLFILVTVGGYLFTTIGIVAIGGLVGRLIARKI